MVGTLLNPACSGECVPCIKCNIWYEDCYIRWECVEEEATVYLDNEEKGSGSEGQIYRPESGLWELRLGEAVLESYEVTAETWNEEECGWCCDVEDAQYVRLQIPNFTFDYTIEVTNRDYRAGTDSIGFNIFLNRVRNHLDFTFGGTYLFPITPAILSPCDHPSPIKIGEGKLTNESKIEGTESRYTGGGFFPVVTCDFLVDAEFSVDVEIFLSSLGCISLVPKPGTWAGSSDWEGVQGSLPQPDTFCGSLSYNWNAELNDGSVNVLRHPNIATVQDITLPICDGDKPYLVGPTSCTTINTQAGWFSLGAKYRTANFGTPSDQIFDAGGPTDRFFHLPPYSSPSYPHFIPGNAIRDVI